ncbi:ATP-binding cassette domain-containing protein [Micromonospora olivasterospora]|uniref:ABC-type multidrug transport system ATPase subunit n=1 Tax=Micromonospora olivasterospora TaxID=1880 RepID=A0A562ICZ2_MICOL|nr:ABC transporter ATP-binding protein [Micromonospora olivasterospora]TWH68585.1 ABC-type multidrug transport system ATPase subunit [Micromonospora olivasterospora]
MSSTTPDADNAIVIDDLSVAYGSTPVLDNFSLTVPAGSARALTGHNGAGKSTLLRCVAGLQEPTGGVVTVFGEPPGKTVEFWRQVATTVESPSWYQGLTVREHLDLVRVANGCDPEDGRIEEVSATLGLTGLEDSLPSTLSSGQRQRFLLTATLVRPSRLLLLDEPEQRLDQTVKRDLVACLRSYVATGGTLLMASHDEDFVGSVGADRVVVGGHR